jgi:acyl-CoA reductase-like NAD-dependent aldehyde dehydrogenase
LTQRGIEFFGPRLGSYYRDWTTTNQVQPRSEDSLSKILKLRTAQADAEVKAALRDQQKEAAALSLKMEADLLRDFQRLLQNYNKMQ